MTNQNKELLFSITKQDLEIVFYRSCSGNGGQKLQKTSSACRITHRPSGAVGDSHSHRKQFENRKEAFKRLVESEKFKSWVRVEAAARFQGYANIEEKLDEMMRPENVKIEVVKDGEWKKQ